MEKKIFTDSRIEIRKCIPAADLPSADALSGNCPKSLDTRGVQADMYRGKLWTMRQYAGFSTAEKAMNAIITC